MGWVGEGWVGVLWVGVGWVRITEFRLGLVLDLGLGFGIVGYVE